jgi:nucleoside-diphosphate-sugar epimerase
MKQQKILITGGNGFLGRNICKLASARQIPIISVSRTGKPAGINETEYSTVEWIAADVFNPIAWKMHLPQCTAVIHSIGIIEELPELGITYERMIFQSARVVSDTALEAGVPRFVFISAGAGAPETPATYMEAKEKAEAYLEKLWTNLAILKPGMIYGKEQPETVEDAAGIERLLSDPAIGPMLRPNRPLEVTVVAKAALECALDYGISGKLSVDKIEKLGN